MSEPTGRHPDDVVVLRPLRADDVATLAAIHAQAFAGFFLAQLGEPFLREFYRGFLGDPTAVTVVAATPTGPLGAAVGTTQPRAFYRRLLVRRWWAFALAGARALLRRPSATGRLVRAVAYRGDPVPGIEGALFASMCVDPAAGGTGLGGRLSRAWSVAAAAHGAPVAYLTTDRDGNDAVNRHHRRHGWRVERHLLTPQGRRMTRYVKDLGPASEDARPTRAQAPTDTRRNAAPEQEQP